MVEITKENLTFEKNSPLVFHPDAQIWSQKNWSKVIYHPRSNHQNQDQNDIKFGPKTNYWQEDFFSSNCVIFARPKQLLGLLWPFLSPKMTLLVGDQVNSDL